MPYLAHFGLEDHPFTLTPNVDYFFPTQEHANIIGSVEFALRRDTGIIKVVGDVGTGKTLLCRLLIKKLVDSEAVAYINAPRANAKSIVLAVCKEFGLEVSDDADAAYGALNQFLVEEHAKSRLAVLVVDEAQHLGREGLELVRLISNLETETRKLLQIVLFGQTELDELLADPSLRQLTQRIAFSLATKPLTIDESKNYINHRIRVSRRPGVEYEVFSPRAVDLLARSCGGVPRVINIVADKSLLAAFAAGAPVVQPAHVAEAIKESPTLVKPVAMRRSWWRGNAGRAALILSGFVGLAAAAVVILALLPAGQASLGARSLLRSLGGALSGVGHHSARQPIAEPLADAPAARQATRAAPPLAPPTAAAAPAAAEVPANAKTASAPLTASAPPSPPSGAATRFVPEDAPKTIDAPRATEAPKTTETPKAAEAPDATKASNATAENAPERAAAKPVETPAEPAAAASAPIPSVASAPHVAQRHRLRHVAVKTFVPPPPPVKPAEDDHGADPAATAAVSVAAEHPPAAGTAPATTDPASAPR